MVETYTATIGVDFKVKTLNIDDQSVRLQIWDTGTFALCVAPFTAVSLILTSLHG